MSLLRRRYRRVPQIVQLAQTECGLVSCQMILRAYGSREPITALREEFEAGRDGLSLRQLRDLLVSRGFESKMYRTGVRALSRVELPAIIYWENYHYVVLEQIDGQVATIVDPASGRRRVLMEELEESYSGRVVTATPRSDFEPIRVKESSPWWDYLGPLRDARGRMAAIGALSLLVFGSGLVTPMLTRELIDDQVAGGGSPSSTILLAIMLFALSLMAVAIGRGLVLASVAKHVGGETMRRVFSHLLALPFRYFAARAPGELLFRLNSVNHVRDLLSTQLVQGGLDLGMSVAMAIFMVYLSPTLAAVSMAFYLVIIGILCATRSRVSEMLDAEMSQSSKSQSMQLESVVAVGALKMSGAEDRFLNDWRGVYAKALTAIQRRTNLQAWINGSVFAAQSIAPLTVFMVGLFQLSKGQMTIGTVVAFQSVSSLFFALATSVFGSYTQLVQASSYLHRLADITTQEKPEDQGWLTTPLAGRIEVEDVTFRYSKHAEPTLEDVSITVNPGERVAIVGTSGSGKSTLGKVLCGLMEPSEGVIRYDGHDLGDYQREHFYSAVGYVPQEVHLLNRSVLDNITMGNPGLGEDDARQAAVAAQIGREIEALPMKYQTLVSEMGGNFSGGQRQRIALARALVKRPSILVLDEATSALDNFNEARINDLLERQNCTVVVIAHRLSTVVSADRIYVMDSGRIVQHGTHDGLVEVTGPYRELFRSSLVANPV